MTGQAAVAALVIIAVAVILILRRRPARRVGDGGPPPRPKVAAPGLSKDAADAIADELAAGHKINAIKIYRSATGQDLKTAKEAVEAIMDGRTPE